MAFSKPTLYTVQTILNQIFNDTDGSVTLNTQPAASSIGHGRKTVTTAGTPVALAASATPSRRVTIMALDTNTGQIAIGGSGVVAASGATRTGVILNAGDTYELDINDLSKIYLDATVSGEGASFAYTA